MSLSMLIFALFSSVNVTFASRIGRLQADKMQPVADMVNTYARYFAVFITMMALGAFVFNIIKMGTIGNNPHKREEAIRGLMISGAVAALVPFSNTIIFFLLKL